MTETQNTEKLPIGYVRFLMAMATQIACIGSYKVRKAQKYVLYALMNLHRISNSNIVRDVHTIHKVTEQLFKENDDTYGLDEETTMFLLYQSNTVIMLENRELNIWSLKDHMKHKIPPVILKGELM